MRARVAGVTGPIVAWKPPAGGGSRSTVGRRRSRRAAGVGRTWPKPSGRSGMGRAPSTHVAAGAAAPVVVVGAGAAVTVLATVLAAVLAVVAAAAGPPWPWPWAAGFGPAEQAVTSTATTSARAGWVSWRWRTWGSGRL